MPEYKTECMNCGNVQTWETRQDAKQYSNMKCYSCGEPTVMFDSTQ